MRVGEENTERKRKADWGEGGQYHKETVEKDERSVLNCTILCLSAELQKREQKNKMSRK